jgi:tyrosine-protein kinase Etk/Wzc
VADCVDYARRADHGPGLYLCLQAGLPRRWPACRLKKKAAGVGSLKALQPLLGDDTTVSAEVEILGSRMVLGRVVEKLKLDLIATPKTFPLIGGTIARRYAGEEPNTPLLGLSSYAWGGEVIQVDSLDVPRPYLDQQLELITG